MWLLDNMYMCFYKATRASVGKRSTALRLFDFTLMPVLVPLSGLPIYIIVKILHIKMPIIPGMVIMGILAFLISERIETYYFKPEKLKLLDAKIEKQNKSALLLVFNYILFLFIVFVSLAIMFVLSVIASAFFQ